VRETRTLRARWRELETEPRTRLHGHAGGNPGYGQADVLTGHRASSRPYQPIRPSDRFFSSQVLPCADFPSLRPPVKGSSPCIVECEIISQQGSTVTRLP